MKRLFPLKPCWAAMLLTLAVMLTATTRAAVPYVVPLDGVVKEARIVSLVVEANGMGQIIADPCDRETEPCDRLVGSISPKTVFMHWLKPLTRQQVRKREWDSATVVLDAWRNVVAIEFMD